MYRVLRLQVIHEQMIRIARDGILCRHERRNLVYQLPVRRQRATLSLLGRSLVEEGQGLGSVHHGLFARNLGLLLFFVLFIKTWYKPSQIGDFNTGATGALLPIITHHSILSLSQLFF